MMVTNEGQLESAHMYGGQPCTCWKWLMGKFDHWVPERDPLIPFGKFIMEEILPTERYFGEAFGYASDVFEIIEEVASEVRQENMGSEEACQIAQDRLEAQHKQFLASVEEMKG